MTTGISGTRTHTHMACLHCRWRHNLLHRDAGSYISSLLTGFAAIANDSITDSMLLNVMTKYKYRTS